jgi:hypothetical protein
MRTENKYEEMLIKEIRGIPTLRVKKGISNNSKILSATGSGLCGIWKDSRDADEIINDIKSARTGFGNRNIEL